MISHLLFFTLFLIHLHGQPFIETDVQYSNLGILSVVCPHFHALHFDCEKLTSSLVNRPKFGMYCLQGQIQLPPFQPLTGILHNYLTGNDYCSKEFRKNIRQYNTAFAMTSVGVKIDNSVTRQSGLYCFKIQEELYHLTGALLPHGDQTPMYAQIYILDTAEQLDIRRNNHRNLDPIVMDNLQTMLLNNHPYINRYRHDLSQRNQQMNNRRSESGCMLIYSRIKELTIYLLLKRLQLSFQRMGFIMQWTTEMWLS